MSSAPRRHNFITPSMTSGSLRRFWLSISDLRSQRSEIRDQKSEVGGQRSDIRLTCNASFPSRASDTSRGSVGKGGSREQLSNAFNQHSDGKRFDQELHVMLGEKGGDFRIGGEPGDEDEPICQRWVHL